MEEKDLYNIAENEDLDIKEYDLKNKLSGIIIDKTILIKKGMSSLEVKCVLAEELGHHFLTVGNICDQTKIENVKQEKMARKWAYNCLIPPDLIKEKIENGTTDIYELAEALEVTEDFLRDAIEEYLLKNKLEKFKEDTG